MRTPVCILLLTFSTAALADDKPAKWEYAELSFRNIPGRPALKDKDGNEIPAVPGVLSLRWTTGSEDMTVKGWDELAEKLKVQIKKDSSPTSQKIQMLNAIGAEGWELVSQETTAPVTRAGGPGGFGQPGILRAGTTDMLFKRRAK